MALARDNRDIEAFSEIVRRYSKPILYMALRNLRQMERAEDALQEVLLTLWKTLDRWEIGHSKVITWVYGHARNAILKALRKNRRLPDQMPENAEEKLPAPESELASPATESDEMEVRVLERLHHCHNRLPELMKSALYAKYVLGMTNQEVADLLEVDIREEKRIMQRARDRLRACMAQSEAIKQYMDARKAERR